MSDTDKDIEENSRVLVWALEAGGEKKPGPSLGYGVCTGFTNVEELLGKEDLSQAEKATIHDAILNGKLKRAARVSVIALDNRPERYAYGGLGRLYEVELAAYQRRCT